MPTGWHAPAQILAVGQQPADLPIGSLGRNANRERQIRATLVPNPSAALILHSLERARAMTLRIFEEATEMEAVIALHGWLSAAEVSEVARVVGAHQGALKIDLVHLVGADAEGLRALKSLQARGACIAGASPFVELLLKRTGEPEK